VLILSQCYFFCNRFYIFLWNTSFSWAYQGETCNSCRPLI